MTSDMTPMDLDDVKRLRGRCSAWLAEGRIWPEILADLEDEEYRPPDLWLVMRGMHAWDEQARQLKADGWPYDDLVLYLSGVHATWSDIASALLQAGMRPADMLRTLLPAALGGEFQEPVIRVAMDRGLDLEECRRVVDWWKVSP